jgi:hypothetical protein
MHYTVQRDKPFFFGRVNEVVNPVICFVSHNALPFHVYAMNWIELILESEALG